MRGRGGKRVREGECEGREREGGGGCKGEGGSVKKGGVKEGGGGVGIS